jgi:hypothetical protein
MRSLLAALFCACAAGFAGPTVSKQSVARHASPVALLGRRRALAGAATTAFFMAGAPAANAYPAQSGFGEIRKANQDAIGVSQVNLPTIGNGAPGASLPTVKIDLNGWKGLSGEQVAVIGPNGAAGGSLKNGFYGGGESPEAKAKLMKRPSKTYNPFNQMVRGGLPGAGRALTDDVAVQPQ